MMISASLQSQPPVCPIREAQLERLEKWTQSHGKDFVAHGVDESNESAVLADGRLRCGENVLRRTGRLEFEGGSWKNERQVLYFPDNFSTELLDEIKEMAEELFQMTDEKIEQNLFIYNDTLNHIEKYGTLFFNKSIPILAPEKGKAEREKQFQEVGIRRGKSDFDKKYYSGVLAELKEETELWKNCERPRQLYIEPVLSIFIDQALPKEKRLKSELARIYQVYERLLSEKRINLTKREVGALLEGVRRTRVFDPVKISNNIWAFRNQYNECYGDNLKILIGDPEPMLGWSLGSHQCSLLSNTQNKGKFFKVDLSGPNVLILGHKVSLREFADDPRFGKNVIFTENIPKNWLSQK